MINDYKIIISAFVSNIVLTGYENVAKVSIKSWSDQDWIDEVLIVDGESIDDTSNILLNISNKVNIVKGPLWPQNTWTQDNIILAENAVLHNVNLDEYEKKIWILLSIDNVLFEENNDLEKICKKLIESDYNFSHLTFKKAICRNHISKNYPYLPNNWYAQGVNKLDKNYQIIKIKDEFSIDTTKSIKRFNFAPNKSAISYDLFFFTKEQIESKISRHIDFKNSPISFKQFILKFIQKMNRIGYTKCDISQHSQYSKILFDLINEQHFGYNMFGYWNKL